MSEVAILGVVAGCLWGVTIALIGIVWSQLKERNASSERALLALQEQNTRQESDLSRLTERSKSMSDRHEEHRSDMSGRFDTLSASMSARFERLEGKIDRLLGLTRPSPYPGTPKIGG